MSIEVDIDRSPQVDVDPSRCRSKSTSIEVVFDRSRYRSKWISIDIDLDRSRLRSMSTSIDIDVDRDRSRCRSKSISIEVEVDRDRFRSKLISIDIDFDRSRLRSKSTSKFVLCQLCVRDDMHDLSHDFLHQPLADFPTRVNNNIYHSPPLMDTGQIASFFCGHGRRRSSTT